MTVCTRFAPSPTGYLHVGGARTALYSWLFAKKHQGQCILRIEDTDQERSTQASIDAILQGMQWLGLECDQGPYYQTDRLARYQECIQMLLEKGLAYKCYCTKERLDALRQQQIAAKQKARYDGHCRDCAAQDGPFVVRFKNPQAGKVSWQDAVKGDISIANSELDDLIIARTDGMPTYNFTVVIDDWDMKVTHVIRGDDHVNNTPRQINLLKALQAPVPTYAHVPMILGEDGKRLSKRHGAVSVMAYAEQGYLPQALLNYLVRLGWSHGDQEIFSVDQMIAAFSLDHISRAPAAFDLKKLKWLNQHYLQTLDDETILPILRNYFEQQQVNLSNGPDLLEVRAAMVERVSTLVELVAQSRYFFEDFGDYEESAAKKHLRPVVGPVLRQLHDRLGQLTLWRATDIHQVLQDTAQALDVGMGKVGMPLRVAITGGSMSPAIDITAELIGQERVLQRLKQAMKFVEDRAHTAG